ncbi:MAG: hypothetical protein Kow0047_00730 [Anaerolineae bacterium]
MASLAARGSALAVSASAVTLTLGLVRSILLARWVLPEAFGVMALALFFVNLMAQLRSIGLDQALIHLPEPTDRTYRTYFTLRFVSLAMSQGVLLLMAPVIARAYAGARDIGWVVLVLTLGEAVRTLSIVQDTLLTRRLRFGSLAAADVLGAATMTLVAPALAYLGWGIWALVAEQISGVAARSLYVWARFPETRPRWGIDREEAGRFWRYGRPYWLAVNVSFLLDRFDDFWTGTALGSLSLGLYSRAYEFARYPRRVVANPLVGVAFPILAAVQRDGPRLARTFHLAAALLLRAGFLVAGALSVIMPEVIRHVIGVQWAPMLTAFRLMLVYTMLDAFLSLCSHLFLAVGRPEILSRVRIVQLVVFVPAVIAGASVAGIEGVAVAADVMLIAGLVAFWRPLREAVQPRWRRLLAWPTVALAAALTMALWLEQRPAASIWWLWGLAKLAAFALVYAAILLGLDGETRDGLGRLWAMRSGWRRHAVGNGS